MVDIEDIIEEINDLLIKHGMCVDGYTLGKDKVDLVIIPLILKKPSCNRKSKADETEMTKWTTKAGSKIAISQMSGYHLRNAIDWLERNAKNLQSKYLEGGHDTLNYVCGEMAEVSIESELNQISEMDDIEFLRQYTQYEALLKEAERRGLRKNK